MEAGAAGAGAVESPFENPSGKVSQSLKSVPCAKAQRGRKLPNAFGNWETHSEIADAFRNAKDPSPNALLHF